MWVVWWGRANQPGADVDEVNAAGVVMSGTVDEANGLVVVEVDIAGEAVDVGPELEVGYTPQAGVYGGMAQSVDWPWKGTTS